ncbi:MAG: hypothetical protein K8T25_08695 [Planctomycetia bacterium]|nr:hypothetical protein [Planctomycetia bacterium]
MWPAVSLLIVVLTAACGTACKRTQHPPDVAPPAADTPGDAAADAIPPPLPPEDAANLEPPPTSISQQQPPLSREERVKLEVVTEYRDTVLLDGPGQAAVNPTTHKLCWPAVVCTNSKCPGKDKDGNHRLFAYRYASVTVGADGKPDWTANEHAPPLQLMEVRPFCFKVNTVEKYIPPDQREHYNDIIRRTREKKKEFDALRRKGGTMSGAKFQEMKDLINEEAALPIYYLCD